MSSEAHRFDLAEIIVEYHGPAAFHNMPCSVCGVNHACLMMNSGVFLPCNKCASDGWMVTRLNWWERWRRRHRIDYRTNAVAESAREGEGG